MAFCLSCCFCLSFSSLSYKLIDWLAWLINLFLLCPFFKIKRLENGLRPRNVEDRVQTSEQETHSPIFACLQRLTLDQVPAWSLSVYSAVSVFPSVLSTKTIKKCQKEPSFHQTLGILLCTQYQMVLTVLTQTKSRLVREENEKLIVVISIWGLSTDWKIW